MRIPYRLSLVSVALVALIVTACGGGGSEPTGGATSPDAADETKTETEAADGEDGPIKVAAIADSSGALAFFGTQANRGWDLALAEVGGSVAGRDVEYIKVQCEEPANCAADTERVIREDGAHVIMGTPGSALALAISAKAAELGVPYFETGSLTVDLLPESGQETEFIFRGAPNDFSFGESAVQGTLAGLEQLGQSVEGATVVVVNESSASNHNQAQVIVDDLRERGAEILDELEYDSSTADFASLAARVESHDPSVLVSVSYVQDGIGLNTELAQRGFRPDVHMLASTGGEQDYFDALGIDYLKGRFAAVYPGLDTPGIEDFLEAYESEFGEAPPSPHPLTFYSTALMLFDILEQAEGSTDPADFREAVMAMDEPEGTYPNGWGAKFASNGQNERVFASTFQWIEGPTACTVLPEHIRACEIIHPSGE